MLKKWLSSPAVTTVLFVLAAGLILFGGINGAQAAPRILSTFYGAQVELDDIDVALTETNTDVIPSQAIEVHGDGTADDHVPLLQNLVPEGEDFQVGRTYTEKLAVRNTQNAKNDEGTTSEGRIIKEYVRVTVYKYWVRKNADGTFTKALDLDPDYIKLHFVTDNGWTEDKDSSTSERTVLYWGDIVYPMGNEEGLPSDTDYFTDTLTIDPAAIKNPAYKNAIFRVEAVVDAVQTHNADDAMMSAWGKNNMINVGSDAED